MSSRRDWLTGLFGSAAAVASAPLLAALPAPAPAPAAPASDRLGPSTGLQALTDAVHGTLAAMLPCPSTLHRCGVFGTKIGTNIVLLRPSPFGAQPSDPVTVVPMSAGAHFGIADYDYMVGGVYVDHRSDAEKIEEGVRRLRTRLAAEIADGAAGLHFAQPPLPAAAESLWASSDELCVRGVRMFRVEHDAFVYRFDIVYGWEKLPRTLPLRWERQLLCV